jgi:predicted transcriptional regulator
MPRPAQIHGELQNQVMRVLWRLESGSVEDVRRGLPARKRGAYTTVQTVLNRLAERGLVRREREGNLILYRPRLSEAEYLSRSLNEALANASPEARRTALATLVGEIEATELSRIRRLAREVSRRRGSR